MEHILLGIIFAAPVFVMGATLLAQRWNGLGAARRKRELAAWVILFAVLTGGLAHSAFRPHTGPVTHTALQRPVMLLGLIPLTALLLWVQLVTLSGVSRGRMWTAFLLRCTMLNLLMLALAGLQMVVEKDSLRVIFALDVSKSVANSERQRAIEFIRKTLPSKKADDEAGLLVFGGRAVLETTPGKLFSPPDAKNIKAVAETDSTDIAQALRRSLNAFDEDSRKRLVLFTDGRQTAGGPAEEELKRIVAMGVDVWIAPLKRGNDAEMLVEKVNVPNELRWEQTFDAQVFVQSNITAQARVFLYLGDPATKNPEPQTADLVPGKNRVTFSGLKLHSGGAKEVRAVLEPLNAADDTLSENNEAYAFTDVQTENRVLLMTSDIEEVKFLLAALEGEKMTVDVRHGPTAVPDNPEVFRAYDCIVLANIGRPFFSDQHMSVIQSCVADQGAGLVMIGGEQSFGAGGYLGTPIEAALPVQMDLENERVMPSGALCIVLHTCEFGDGNAWGKKISKAAISVLTPQDYAGVIYFDHSKSPGEQWAFKPAKVRKEPMFNMIDRCDPGDMPSLAPVIDMAVKSLVNLPNVSVKHCIVISDGDPSPPTAATLAAAKAGKVTITTISIFPHGGREVGMLKDVAAQTGGRYYSADDPKKLPQIFIKEAAVVRKSLIPSDEHGYGVRLAMSGPTLKEFGSSFPDVKTFVMTRPRPEAELQLFTVYEGEKAPVLMSWHHGLGKSAAFTSDCTNRWGAKWVSWPSYKKFWTNLLTWVSRQRMPANHTVTTTLKDGIAHVTVEGVDSKGEYINFAKLTGNAIDPDVARNGLDAQSYDLNFTMTAPGKYEAVFPVKKAGAYAVTVMDLSNPKKPQTIVTGLANSYSPEFLHLEGDDALLARLGEIAARDGVSRFKDMEKLDPAQCGLFAHDLPPVRQPADLFWPLLLLAACIFPFDVAIRRLALDPEAAWVWLWRKASPVLERLRLKKEQLQTAAAEAITGSAPASEVVPSGANSREAQSRYEQAGGSAEAQNMDLNPAAGPAPAKPAVGGTKLTQSDAAASNYTRALLKAKKRAQREEDQK